MTDCALCDDARLSDDDYARVFVTYGQGARRNLKQRAAAGAATLAQEITGDTSIDGDLVWRHFAYHRRAQPAPPGYLKRDRSLQAIHEARLSQRQLDILGLVCRLDVVSTPQLLPLLYGSLATLGAQRAACYRDLRALVRGQFLYRSHPPRRRIPQAAPGGPSAYLHPGREAIAYSESVLGHTPAAITAPADIDWDTVQRRQRANATIIALALALPDARFQFGSDAGRVRLIAGNWFGPGPLQARVSAPFDPKGRTSHPDGMITASIEVPARNTGALFPMAYIDAQPGWGDERIADEVYGWAVRLATPDGRAQPFPDLETLQVPLLVISPDSDTSRRAREATITRLAPLPSVSRPPVLFAARAALAQAWMSPVITALDGTETTLHLALTSAMPPAEAMKRLPLGHRLVAADDHEGGTSGERRRARSVSPEEVWSGPLQQESGRRRHSAPAGGPTPPHSPSTS